MSDPVEAPSDAADRAPHTVSASDFEDEELKAALAQPVTTRRELWSWYAYGEQQQEQPIDFLQSHFLF